MTEHKKPHGAHEPVHHAAPETTIPARPEGDQAYPPGGEQIVVGGGPYREDSERGHPRHLRHEAIRMATEEMADKIAGSAPGKSADEDVQREAAKNINPRETVNDYVELQPTEGSTPALGDTPLQPVLQKTQEEAEAEAKEEFAAGHAPPEGALPLGSSQLAPDNAETQAKAEADAKTDEADVDEKAKTDAKKAAKKDSK